MGTRDEPGEMKEYPTAVNSNWNVSGSLHLFKFTIFYSKGKRPARGVYLSWTVTLLLRAIAESVGAILNLEKIIDYVLRYATIRDPWNKFSSPFFNKAL